MNPVPLRERVVSWVAEFISRRARWVAAGTLVLVGAFGIFLPRATPRNDTDDFVVDRHPAMAFHREFKKIFIKEEFFVIAYREEDLFTPFRLNQLKDLTSALLEIEAVQDVTSLANIPDMRGTEDSFEVDDFLREIPSDPKALEALRERALANPLYRKTVLSDDGRTTALVVFVRESDYDRTGDEDTQRRQTVQAVEKALAPFQESGMRLAVAGWPMTNYYLAEYMNADAKLFFPISLLLTLGTVWYVFRNLRLLLLAGVGILLTLTATLGLAGLAGIPLNNASVAAVPLVMSLALSDMVHIFSHLDRRVLKETGGRPQAALARVLASVLFPCLLTSINTGVGFFSYTFNSVTAIRSFGWLASAGMMFEFIVSFGLIAPLLSLLPPEKIYRDPEVHQQRAIPRFLRWTHSHVTRRPVWPLLLCLGALVWAGWAGRGVRVNTNLEEFFKPSSPLRVDLDFVRKNLAGMEPIDISFQAARDTFKDPAILTQVEVIERKIESLPRVDSATGIGDFFKEMNKAFHAEAPSEYRLPKSRRLLEQYLLLYGRDDLDDYITPAFDHARLMIRANAPSSEAARDLIQEIQNILDEHPVPGVTARITGSLDLGVKTIRVMVNDQVQSILSTVFVVAVLMGFVLRSWGLTLLFLVPNLFPILINYGIMGTFGIPLDTGTALIAASAFGIIVDDTVHFFVAYGQRRRQGKTVALALEETAFEKGEAAVSSFLILGIAFSVLTLSHFQPIFYFGLLNMLILLVGMVGDQVFLKSILSLWARWADRGRAPT